MDTHYLVTEHGAVNLMGKSTYERALEMVKLAPQVSGQPDCRGPEDVPGLSNGAAAHAGLTLFMNH